MKRNNYAAKLVAVKARLSDAERKELIGKTFETTYKLSVIALNRAFGIGNTRAKVFENILNELFTEYGKLIDEVDEYYADGKIDEAYQSIVGKRLEKNC